MPSTATIRQVGRQISSAFWLTQLSQPSIIPVKPRPALSTWFCESEVNIAHLTSSGLADPLVPIEHTNVSEGTFERLEIPWSYYLTFLEQPPKSGCAESSLYLAQVPPPRHLENDVAPPKELRDRMSKSSIWMGLSPTTTPLHRDPDHNVLYQIRGSKNVRLCEPSIGSEILRKARFRANVDQGSEKMRGEEMMRPGKGGERDELEQAIWDDWNGEDGQLWEAQINRGEALFIPKGWWHAVRGRRAGEHEEVIASVNWWFR